MIVPQNVGICRLFQHIRHNPLIPTIGNMKFMQQLQKDIEMASLLGALYS